MNLKLKKSFFLSILICITVLICFKMVFTQKPISKIYLNHDIKGLIKISDCNIYNDLLICKFEKKADVSLDIFNVCEYNYYGQNISCKKIALNDYIYLKNDYKIRKITIGL
jgi:C4-dicarboxylate transporter